MDNGDNFRIEKENASLKIVLPESLKMAEVKKNWRELNNNLHGGIKAVTVEAFALKDIDNSGAAMIAYIDRSAHRRKIDFQLNGISEQLCRKVELFCVDPPTSPKQARLRRFVETIGRKGVSLAEEFKSNISFVGRITAALANVVIHPRSLRWKDTLVVSELAGANSFWICAMIGVLFGLILAFQSAMPMKKFGAEIYVASLVSMSLFRVLGPFIAALLFTARSASAFAAEIGTMKVNEEIDALITMGFDPVKFLTLPRMICGIIFVPLLAAVVNLFGLIGMISVMISLGYPYATIHQQVVSFTTLGDMTGGLFKAVIFGFLVAGVGCLRGLQTGKDSQAVGQSTTSAVVSGIVLVVVAEGFFAVIFYVLGI